MKRILFILFLLTTLVVVGLSQKPRAQKVDMAAELNALAENERAFSRMAAAQGRRTAFLAYIADDCILFRPTPVNGKQWWTQSPDNPGLLSWEPVYVDLARAADLGYSVGPWEFRPKGPEDKPAASGYYMSIWRRQADGSWKFVIDQGTPTPPHSTKPSLSLPADFERNVSADRFTANVAQVQNELLEQERAFSRSSASNTLEAFLAYAAVDIRFMRPRHFPAIGKEEMRKALVATPGTLKWEPTQAFAARSGELGYTYGAYEFRPAAQGDQAAKVEKGNYVHIWKRKSDGQWMLVLEVLNPYGGGG
jgi:ketosteroid isomerase-like protein